MRKLQRFSASLSLALALSIPAMAGDVHTGSPQKSSPPPPPPPPQSLVYETCDANLADPLAELALALLNGVLSIF